MVQARQVSRLALCVVMVLFVSSVNGSSSCTTEKFLVCVKELSNSNTDVDIFTTFNAKQVRTKCRENKFPACVAPMKSQCGSGIALAIENIESGLNFICEESNIKELAKHEDCLQKMTYKKTMKSCIETYTSDAQTVGSSRSRTCRISKAYLTCMTVPVSSACGPEAARYFREVMLHTIKPSLDLIGCSISSAKNRAGSSIVVIAMAVLILPAMTLLGV